MKKSKNGSADLFFSFTWDYLNEYLPNQVGRSAATIASYRDSLSLFRRYLTEETHTSIAKFKFSDCTKDFIYDFRDYLRQKDCKPSTINVRITAIRAYLFYAAEKDVAIQSVALSISKVPPCKVAQKEKPLLSEEALAAILAAPPQTKMGLRDRTILVLLYDSAMRLDELLSIQLKHITFSKSEPHILLHGKGKKERRVALTERTGRQLKEYLRVYHPSSNREAFLICTTINGYTGRMSESNVQRLINQYADIARHSCPDIPAHVHPHMFRRTRATDLYRDGVALELVSVILGHSHVDTTKIYATPSLEQLRDANESVPTPAAEEKPLWVGNEDEMALRCGLR